MGGGGRRGGRSRGKEDEDERYGSKKKTNKFYLKVKVNLTLEQATKVQRRVEA